MEKQAIIQRLFEAARETRDQAYAPYSRYKVGAALIDETGSIHTGCNVEAANFKGGTCAEGTAISDMIKSGQRLIVDIAIVGKDNKPCPPCGHCRQLIREFANPDTRIHVLLSENKIRTYTIEELLPDSFGPDNLLEAAD